jgi:hypothetical protein
MIYRFSLPSSFERSQFAYMSSLQLGGDYYALPLPPPPGMSAHKWRFQYALRLRRGYDTPHVSLLQGGALSKCHYVCLTPGPRLGCTASAPSSAHNLLDTTTDDEGLHMPVFIDELLSRIVWWAERRCPAPPSPAPGERSQFAGHHHR